MMITAPASAIGWTFLVARGRHTDYRTVLAPDFLVDARGSGILSYSVTQADARPGEVRTIDVTAQHGERLYVHYRNESLSGPGAWPGGPKSLRDEHGRPFEIVYGVVTRSARARVDDPDLAQARDEALESYRHFLEHEDDHGVARSDGFALGSQVEEVAPERPVIDRPSTPVRQPPRRPGWLVAAGASAVVAIAAIGIAIAIASSSGSNPSLVVHPQANACTQPAVFAASIATNGPHTVAYQWDSATGQVLGQGQLRFPAAGSQQLSLTTGLHGAVSLHVSGSGQTRIVTFRC